MGNSLVDISLSAKKIVIMTRNQKTLLWIIVALAGGAFWCLFYFVRGLYSYIGVMDAFTFSGVAILLFYGLYLVYRWGAFDMIVYGFKDLFYHMNPSNAKIRKYDDYGDYREQKKEMRKRSKPYFWPFLIIGIALILTFIVMRIVFSVNYPY